MHLALLGDSIFDNQAYVQPHEPDVRAQVAAQLPTGATATLLAMDGAVLSHIPGQLGRLPKQTTHVAISIGGNNLLGYLGILNLPAQSISHAIAQMSAIRQEFKTAYENMVDSLERLAKTTLLSTIYYPNYPDPSLQTIAITALALFNDVIITTAIQRGWPLLELRLICSDPSDYANPIEPSAKGGAKIAAVMVKALTTHDFGAGRTVIYDR